MMKYGEKFENFFRKGAQILAFSKRNFFSDHPLPQFCIHHPTGHRLELTRNNNISEKSLGSIPSKLGQFYGIFGPCQRPAPIIGFVTRNE